MWQIKISDQATVNDTINLIRKTINDYADSAFVSNLTDRLKAISPTDESFFKNLFSFACKNVEYERDPTGHEKITTPERLIKEGKGDCKKFSTLIGAVLKKAGFKPVLKVVSYDGNTYAHIYIIVPVKGERKYITLDPVNRCLYDKEVKHRKAWIHNLKGENMELSLLGRPDSKAMFANLRQDPKFRAMCYHTYMNHRGKLKAGSGQSILGAAGDLLNEFSELTGEPVTELLGDYDNVNMLAGLSGAGEYEYQSLLGQAPDSLSGYELLYGEFSDLGKREKRKKGKGKIWGFMKKIGLAPSRIAFLGMVRINLFGIAKKLYKSWQKDQGARLKKLWKKLGGNPAKLFKTIEKGVARLKKKGKLKGIAEYNQDLSGLGVAPIAAVLAAAVPILTAVATLFKKQGTIDKNNPDDVKFVQQVDQAETQLVQKIDSGEANQVVQQVQDDSRFQPAPDQGGQVNGLGALDWGKLFKSVSNVVKVARPTIKATVNAVRTIKAASNKTTNPVQKKQLAQASTTATALLKKQQATTNPIEKKQIGQDIVEVLNNVQETIKENLPGADQPSPGLEKSAGSFSGGTWIHKVLKVGVGIGYIQTFYGSQIIEFITNIIK